MSSVIVVGSIDALIVAARIPNSRGDHRRRSPSSAPASTSGENPRSTAPFSFSAAARVARPKRVKRKTAHRTTVAATTSPARISWSCAERRAEDVDGTLLEQRLDGDSLRSEAQDDDRLEHQQQPDRRDNLGQRWSVAQRPEHEEVQEQPGQRGDHEAERERRTERERGAERQ